MNIQITIKLFIKYYKRLEIRRHREKIMKERCPSLDRMCKIR